MSRNREKDEADKAKRRLLAMESGFRLFSEKGIDSVKMSDIVADCGVSSSFHIMLAAVTRYAMGLAYVPEDDDLEKELILLEEALLGKYIVQQ